MNKIYYKVLWVDAGKESQNQLSELMNDDWQVFFSQPTDNAVLMVLTKLSDIVANIPVAPLKAEAKKK